FVVFGEPTPGREPGEGPLHNPPPFQHVEASGADRLPIDDRILGGPNPSQAAPGMLDNLDDPSKRLLDPLDEAPLAVGAVSPDEFESWKASSQRLQELFAPFLILDIGLMNQHL